ncbi:MAG TPA: DUF58 domain-containing protein [Sedimenticola sp.]|nr:DUF58 domain-containing protein [Sedimenticola sp.]
MSIRSIRHHPWFTPFRRFLRLARAGEDGWARIRPRHIYILPTRFGAGFALLLLLMLTGSINYASNLAFLLTFLLAGLGLITMIHTWANLVALELSAAAAQPVFSGQAARFPVRLRNRRRTPRPGILLQLGKQPPAAADIAAGETVTLTLSVSTSRRGERPLPRLTLSTRHPLGLFRAWVYVELRATCLVYPRPGKPGPRSGTPDYRQSPRGDRGSGADDFVGLRPYRPGDSPRHLDWRSLARGQVLQTKQFGGDRSEQLQLDWYSLQGGTEHRLSSLCRGVIDACEQQQEYGLRLPGKEIPAGRGQAHRHRCLAALARFTAQP